MRISRRELDDHIYFCSSDDEGHITGLSQSLPMLLRTGGLGATHLIQRFEERSARVAIPVLPTKIICVGLNYRLHAEESGKPLPEVPLIFLKPLSALIAHQEPIVLPDASSEVHYEGELAVVIGKRAKGVPAARASEYILGYTIMNDVTARDIQRSERLYTRSKGFDTFAPLGPEVVTGLDPDQLTLTTTVNGEVKQSTRCDDMIFKVPELIAFISSVMTLEPGDIISTGTPSGVGPLGAGDEVSITISGLATLTNPVQ